MSDDHVDLRSDTVTRPTPEMRRAIADAVVGDDVFKDDPTVVRLEELAAQMTGKDAGLFVPSGTMGNEICILTHTRRGDEVIIDHDSHIYRYEAAGPAVLSGVQLAPIQTDGGVFSVAQVEQAIRPDDEHQPPTRLLCLENTHNRKGGVVYPIDMMWQVSEVAKKHGLRIHLDGARIFNASAASGTDVKEYCSLCDSIMFCLSKGLGAPIGSIAVGDRDFIKQARRYRKLLGGGMRQVGIIAAAGIYALQHNVERLSEDHRRARYLAEGLSSIETLAIDMETVQTNIVVVDIARSGFSVQECLILLEKKGVLVVPFGRTKIRAVTHLDINDGDVDRAVATFEKVFVRA
jgi:threonine aldolase